MKRIAISVRARLRLSLLLSPALLLLSGAPSAMTDAQLEANVDALMAKMTLKEKIGQMNQVNYYQTEEQAVKAIEAGQAGSLLNPMGFHEEADLKKINALQRLALEHSPSKIPLLIGRDVIHGFRTVFPVPLGLAATFNPQLIQQTARVAGMEARASGIHVTFAPMLDISRDARWGRIAESFGEDPYLTTEMGIAMVNGFQTEDLSNPTAIGATAKHFFGYGATEGGRDYNSTHIPPGQLHNVYLPPFKAAVDNNVLSLMTAFNENDGIPATANHHALEEILRTQWGFKGFVVSDWNATGELITHGYVKDRKEAAEKAVNAGVDLEMVTGSFVENLEALVHEGKVSPETIDDRVRNILRAKYRMGLFDNPWFDEKAFTDAFLKPDYLRLAQQTAEQSVVMLKNAQQTLPLPLNSVKRLAIIGPLADKPREQLGTWSWDGDAQAVVTPLAAFQEVKELTIDYEPGLDFSRSKNSDAFDKVKSMVGQADAAIVFLGEEAILSGEAHSLANLNLVGAQSELLAAVKQMGKPVVLVIMAGRPLTIERDLANADAVLYSFHPGTMGGPALRDLILGKQNPSGKLPVTFVRQVGQIPLYYNHNSTGRPAPEEDRLATLENIPVGAEQTSLGNTSYYLDAGRDPLFPFGYGLSYTHFDYADLHLSTHVMDKTDTLTITVKVTNSGEVAGTEVVQLYLRDPVSSRVRPVKELKGFQRVPLQPGESKSVSFTLRNRELAAYNAENRFIAEPGDIDIWVGGDSQHGQHARFTLR